MKVNEKTYFPNFEDEEKERIKQLILKLSDEELLQLYNDFCRNNNDYDNVIYENDEYFLRDMFGDDVNAVAKAVSCGEYECNHSYVKCDGHGNLKSYPDLEDALDDNFYIDEVIEFVMQNKIF